MSGQDLLVTIEPDLRARLRGVVPDWAIEAFFRESRDDLVGILDELLQEGAEAAAAATAQADDPPELWTPAQRTRANLEAMRLLVRKRPDTYTLEDRRTLLGFSGMGGLSIEKIKDQVPPGLVPDSFALIHEFYTPPGIADAIAERVCPLLPQLAGADGVVRILEPSVGIGRFPRAIARPQCLAAAGPVRDLHWITVELSAVSSRLFQALRPDAEHFQMPLERFMQKHAPRYRGTIHLILANPPYGERGAFALEDPDPFYEEDTAYGYFMRRTLDLLVPGGMGVFLVPRSFLNNETGTRKLRERILRRHHLLAAYRLPSHRPGGSAVVPGTRVVMDLVFFQARGGELIDPDDRFIVDGHYFERHPEHILGVQEFPDTPGREGWRYRVVGEFSHLPPWQPRPVCMTCRLGTITVRDSLPVISGAEADAPDPEGASASVRAALSLGRRVNRLLAAVSAGDDEMLAALWPELHAALVAFRGVGHEAAGGRPRWPEVRALADGGHSAAQGFFKAFTKEGELIEVLARRPISVPRFRGKLDDVAGQADLLFRRQRRLTVTELADFHRQLGGTLDAAELLGRLLPAGWNLDGPHWDELYPDSAYYSGLALWDRHDRAKRRATLGDPRAAAQAERLLAAIGPAVFEDLPHIGPAASFLPPSLVAAWLSATLNAVYPPIELERRDGLLQPKNVDYVALEDGGAGLTPATVRFLGWANHDYKLFKPVRKRGGPSAGEIEAIARRLTEERETLQAAWTESFHAWLLDHETERAIVVEAYNRAFKGRIVPTYSDAPLGVVRWGKNAPTLHPHQNAAARRVLDQGAGLVALDVGVGKTLTATVALAKLRQDGVVQRAVILTPGSLVWQWYDEIRCALPDYQIEVIGNKRVRLTRPPRKGLITSRVDTPEERAEKWVRFQTGQLDLVILSYDMLGRTKIRESSVVEYARHVEAIQRKVALRRRNLSQASKQRQLSEREKAIMEHGVEAWVRDLIKLPEGRQYDPGIVWDDLGIDLLIVDEAASFKNLYYPQAREEGVPKFMGGSGDGSDRAWQLDFRAAIVRRNTGGGGVVLLTATPAKNSPLEFYNLIQFIDPRAFTQSRIYDPEQFIEHFCKIERKEVLDSAFNVVEKPALVGFKNLDDLRTLIFSYGEFRTAKDVGLALPEPQPDRIPVEMDEVQEEKYGVMVALIEAALKNKRKAGSKILGLLARLSMVALHGQLDEGYTFDTALHGGLARRKVSEKSLPSWTERGWSVIGEEVDEDDAAHYAIERHLPPPTYESPKLVECAKRVAASPGCGHIIFCEPTAVHAWMREVLVAHGIPRERIAILNADLTVSADRTRIAADFNGLDAEPPKPGMCTAGRVRLVAPKFDIIIANSVAYEGINLQTRTCVIHHLDLPHTPSDLEQRNGRAVRQGNTLGTVKLYYYLSERSADGYRFGLINGKASWLGEVLQSTLKETNNPAAGEELTPEDILLMISRNPDRTREVLQERRERLRQEYLTQVRREAGSLLRQASARFRDARSAEPALATRLREDAERRLSELAKADPEAWPWASLAHEARDTEIMVPPVGTPLIWDGLRVALPAGEAPEYLEFSTQGTQGPVRMRRAGSITWRVVPADVLERLRPELYLPRNTADWPSDDNARTNAELVRAFGQVASGAAKLADLELGGASDAFLGKWWPLHHDAIKAALVRSGEPAPVVVQGTFVVRKGPLVREGQILPPSKAGFSEALTLAAESPEKETALRAIAETWWSRTLPDLKELRERRGRAREAAMKLARELSLGEAAVLHTLLALSATIAQGGPASEEARQAREGVPARHPDELDGLRRRGLVDGIAPTGLATRIAEFVPRATSPRQTEAPPRPASSASQSTSPPVVPTTSTRVGHFYRVGDQIYGDTALIDAFQTAGFPAEHAGFGYFDVVLPRGKVAFNRHADESLFADQVGRLHLLVPDSGVDLADALEDLVARGYALSGGAWTDWPRRDAESDVHELEQRHAPAAHSVEALPALPAPTDTLAPLVVDRAALRRALGEDEIVEALTAKASGMPTVNVGRMWSFYTTSTYRSGDLPLIATREALQNGIDAIKAAIRGRKTRADEGRFSVTWDPEQRALTWEDNGIGMDADTILTKFLSLGDTGKGDVATSEEAAGGFGVAKAVILGTSETFRWEMHTRDNRAVSEGPNVPVQIFDAPYLQGTRITIFDVPARFASTHDHVRGEDVALADRLRELLAANDLPGVTLVLDGREVAPMFSRRGGSSVPIQGSWGEGTRATIKAYRRPPGDRRGAYYVRLGGLFQFRMPNQRGNLKADILIDLVSTVRPGTTGYPLNAARDEMQGRAYYNFQDLVREVERESESVARGQEDLVFDPDSDDDDARQGADELASLAAEAFADAEFQKTLADVAGGIADYYAEREKYPEVTPTVTSAAPPGSPAPHPDEIATRPQPLPPGLQLAARATRVAEDIASPVAPKEAAKELRSVLGAAETIAGGERGVLSPEVADLLDRIERGQPLDERDLGMIQTAVDRAADSALGPGGGGILQAVAVTHKADHVLLVLRGEARPKKLKNPFGRFAGLRLSKKNYDRQRYYRFRKNYAKWIPHLIAWDATLRLIAAEAQIRRTFKPGFILDDTLLGLAQSGSRGTAVVYVHPDRFAQVVKAHRERPLAIAAFLHGVGCHELTHVDGRMGEGHNEAFVMAREDLGNSTSHLLPAIAVLVQRLLGLPARPSEDQRRIATLERQIARIRETSKDTRKAATQTAPLQRELERCRAELAEAQVQSARVRIATDTRCHACEASQEDQPALSAAASEDEPVDLRPARVIDHAAELRLAQTPSCAAARTEPSPPEPTLPKSQVILPSGEQHAVPSPPVPAPVGVDLVELNDGRWISADEARTRYLREKEALGAGRSFDPTGDYGIPPVVYAPPAVHVDETPSPRPRSAPAPRIGAPKDARPARPELGRGGFLTVPDVAPSTALALTVGGPALAAAARHLRRAMPKGSPVWIYATDGAMWLVGSSVMPDGSGIDSDPRWLLTRMPAEVASPGVFVARVDDLEHVADKGTIELSSEGDRLHVRTGGRRITLRPLRPWEHMYVLPQPRISGERLWPATTLRDALRAVLFAVSREPKRVNMTNVLVDPQGERVAFVAVDGSRLVRFDTELPALSHPTQLPLTLVEHLPALLGESGAVRIGTDVPDAARWIGLGGETSDFSWTWIVREPRTVFPPYVRVIPERGNLTCTIDGKQAARALARLVSFAEVVDRTPMTVWTMTETELFIGYMASYMDGGTEAEAAVRVPLECVLPKGRQGGARVGVNPRYVLDALETWPLQGRVHLSLQFDKKEQDSLNPLRLDAEGSGWRATVVIMPMRTGGRETQLRASETPCGAPATTTRSLHDAVDWTVPRTGLTAELTPDLLADAVARVLAIAKMHPELTSPPQIAVVADRGRVSLALPVIGLGIRVDVPARVDAPGVGLARPEALRQAAVALREEGCVHLRLHDGALTVATDAAVFRVGGVFDASFDLYDHRIEVLRATVPTGVAALALKSAIDAAGDEDDESRLELGHIRVRPTERGAALVASDGVVALRVELDAPWTMPAFSLSTSAAKAAVAALGETKALGITGQPGQVRLVGVGSPVEWVLLAQGSGARSTAIEEYLTKEAADRPDYACTLRAAELRSVLTQMRRAVEAEEKRLAVAYKARTGARNLPARRRQEDGLDVRVAATFGGEGMTLQVHSAAEGQTWRVPMRCPPIERGITAGFDPTALRILLASPIFADAEVEVELFRERRPLRLRAEGDGWRATALLAGVPLRPILPLDPDLVRIALEEVGELAGGRTPSVELLIELGLEKPLRTEGPLEPRVRALRTLLEEMKERKQKQKEHRR